MGVKSNVRLRRNGRDTYVSLNSHKGYEYYDGWLPIGGVFWVNYRTDGEAVIEKITPVDAVPNVQFFTESIINWEMKEDIADYFSSNPFRFANYINTTNKMINDFCYGNNIYYLNLDIFSSNGLQKTIDIIEECISISST